MVALKDIDALNALMPLNYSQLALCYNTISSRTFYMIVGDALTSCKQLSVVRMGDGERRLVEDSKIGHPDSLVENGGMPERFARLGLTGITKGEMLRRLELAGSECTYFAPSLIGIQRWEFCLHELFPPRQRYVDNFFVNEWDEDAKIKLFKAAGHVLLIHGNPATADAMQIRAQGNLGVKVSYLHLSNWEQTEGVIEQAARNDAPLVLYSAGPAGKYIGPAIVQRSSCVSKVAIDIGAAIDQWTLGSLPTDQEAADKFAREHIKPHFRLKFKKEE